MTERLILPKVYWSKLNIMETQLGINIIKDTFERELCNSLNLTRVSAPLMVTPSSGLNDNLNGIERPVTFDIPDVGCDAEIVHSLAKWKRLALKKYGFAPDTGLYTDMNAIRRDEKLDNLHSIYVDQWDWEAVIDPSERNLDFLYSVVNKIIKAIKKTQNELCKKFDQIDSFITSETFFISSEELLKLYPNLTAKERENAICKDKKTVFISGIGKKLSNGEPHDMRAPDYDDWELNGDILVWYEPLQRAIELSSMGIRVDKSALESQLEITGNSERKKLDFHKMLLNGQLPYTMGGGIGQSRLSMIILEKAHIGEVQSSIWSEEMINDCSASGIMIL